MIHQACIWILWSVDEPVPLWIKSICSEHAYILATDLEEAWLVTCIVCRQSFSHTAHPRPRAEEDSCIHSVAMTKGSARVYSAATMTGSTPTLARWLVAVMKLDKDKHAHLVADRGEDEGRGWHQAAGICLASIEPRVEAASVMRAWSARHLRHEHPATGETRSTMWASSRHHPRHGRRPAVIHDAGVERRRRTGCGSKLLESPQRRLRGFLLHRCQCRHRFLLKKSFLPFVISFFINFYATSAKS